MHLDSASLLPIPQSRRRREPGRVTPREAQILNLATLQTRDIAAELGISPYTVKQHFKRIYESLGVETRAQAAVVWQQRKFMGQGATDEHTHAASATGDDLTQIQIPRAA